MIQGTLDRLGDAVPVANRFVLTNEALVDAVAQQLPELPRENIVGEPASAGKQPPILGSAD